jgi:hypothetical protein
LPEQKFESVAVFDGGLGGFAGGLPMVCRWFAGVKVVERARLFAAGGLPA